MKLTPALSAPLCVALLGGCGHSEPHSYEPKFSVVGSWLGSCEGNAFWLRLAESTNPYLPGQAVQGEGYCLPSGPGIPFYPVSAEGWNYTPDDLRGTPVLLNMTGGCLPAGHGQFRGSWSGPDAITGVFERGTDTGLAGGPFYPLTLQRK